MKILYKIYFLTKLLSRESFIKTNSDQQTFDTKVKNRLPVEEFVTTNKKTGGLAVFQVYFVIKRASQNKGVSEKTAETKIWRLSKFLSKTFYSFSFILFLYL